MKNPELTVAIAALPADDESFVASAGLTSLSGNGNRNALPSATPRQRRADATRTMLRAVLKRAWDIDQHAYRFEAEPTGKPWLRSLSGSAMPHISISHTRRMLLVAATWIGPIGIDLEYRLRHRPFADIAAFAFGPQECAIVGSSPQRFYRVWTLREALSKATGQGLALATDRKDRFAAVAEDGCWFLHQACERWLMCSLETLPDHTMGLAVACAARNPPSTTTELLQWWNLRNEHRSDLLGS